MAKIYTMSVEGTKERESHVATLGTGFRKFENGTSGIRLDFPGHKESTVIIVDVEEALTMIRLLSNGIAEALRK